MLARWDAVSTLDRIFDDVMGNAFGTATSARAFEPAVDVRTSEGEVLLACDVPGVARDDLEVTLENRVLTIKGTRRFDARENEQVMLGRAYGSFRRVFTLPDGLDEGALTATLEHGVLTVRIPRHPKAMPRRIEIASGSDPKKLAP